MPSAFDAAMNDPRLKAKIELASPLTTVSSISVKNPTTKKPSGIKTCAACSRRYRTNVCLDCNPPAPKYCTTCKGRLNTFNGKCPRCPQPDSVPSTPKTVIPKKRVSGKTPRIVPESVGAETGVKPQAFATDALEPILDDSRAIPEQDPSGNRREEFYHRFQGEMVQEMTETVHEDPEQQPIGISANSETLFKEPKPMESSTFFGTGASSTIKNPLVGFDYPQVTTSLEPVPDGELAVISGFFDLSYSGKSRVLEYIQSRFRENRDTQQKETY